MGADLQTELAAMKRIANTLDALDDYTQERVLVWVRDRYERVDDLADQPGQPPLAHLNT